MLPPPIRLLGRSRIGTTGDSRHSTVFLGMAGYLGPTVAKGALTARLGRSHVSAFICGSNGMGAPMPTIRTGDAQSNAVLARRVPSCGVTGAPTPNDAPVKPVILRRRTV